MLGGVHMVMVGGVLVVVLGRSFLRGDVCVLSDLCVLWGFVFLISCFGLNKRTECDIW